MNQSSRKSLLVLDPLEYSFSRPADCEADVYGVKPDSLRNTCIYVVRQWCKKNGRTSADVKTWHCVIDRAGGEASSQTTYFSHGGAVLDSCSYTVMGILIDFHSTERAVVNVRADSVVSFVNTYRSCVVEDSDELLYELMAADRLAEVLSNAVPACPDPYSFARSFVESKYRQGAERGFKMPDRWIIEIITEYRKHEYTKFRAAKSGTS